MKVKGFFKGAGQALEVLGATAGLVVQKSCQTLSHKTGMQEIEKIGDLAKVSTAQTGKILGDIVESCGLVAEGVLNDDLRLAKDGALQIGGTVKTTAIGVGQGLAAAGGVAVATVDAITDGDYAKAKQSATQLGILVAASVIGVGIVEGLDIVEHSSVPENTHFVHPHEVSEYVKSDGTVVEGYWRDGDGNTNIDLDNSEGGGYLQGNPDGIESNNLNS